MRRDRKAARRRAAVASDAFWTAAFAAASDASRSAMHLAARTESAISADVFEASVSTVLWWRSLTPTDRGLTVSGAVLVAGTVLLMTGSLVAVGLLAIFLAFAAFCLRRPWWAIYALLLSSPFYFMWNSALTSGQLGFTTKLSPVDLLAGLSLVYFALARWRTGLGSRLDVLDLAGLVWIAVALLALGHGVLEGYEASFRSSRGPLLWVLYFPAAALVTMDERRRRETWRVLLAAAAIVGGVDLLASLGLLTRAFPSLPVGIVGGVFIRPNFFGDTVLMIPSIVLVLALLAIGRWSPQQRFALVALGTLDLAILMISVTRGFWLGMFAALIVLIVVLAWRRMLTGRTFVLGLLGSLAGVALIESVALLWRRVSLVGALVERAQTVLTGDPQSIDVRLAESGAYLDSFLRAPILGNGFGAPVHFSPIAETTGFAHNQYVWVLQTTGIVGFCALGALLLLVLWRSIAALRRARTDKEAYLTPVFVCATFVGLGVTSLISPEFTNITTVPLLAVATAMVRAQGAKAAPTRSR